MYHVTLQLLHVLSVHVHIELASTLLRMDFEAQEKLYLSVTYQIYTHLIG